MASPNAEILVSHLVSFGVRKQIGCETEAAHANRAVDFGEVEVGLVIIVVIEVTEIKIQATGRERVAGVNIVFVGEYIPCTVIDVRHPGADIKPTVIGVINTALHGGFVFCLRQAAPDVVVGDRRVGAQVSGMAGQGNESRLNRVPQRLR